MKITVGSDDRISLEYQGETEHRSSGEETVRVWLDGGALDFVVSYDNGEWSIAVDWDEEIGGAEFTDEH